jgi:hypothetical protein
MSRNWPDDADGDVMRRLQDANFDFSREVELDFNVDFETWPPNEEVMASLARIRPDARLTLYDEDKCVLIQITALLTYHFVLSVQAELTEIT